MSRTRKDRPFWVMRNDPKMARHASHSHLVAQTELVGEEPVYHTKWGTEEQYWYTRRLYKRWYIQVDCTLDIPEGTPSTWRLRYPRLLTNEDRLREKNCHWNLDYYPNIRSNKDFKRLTNKAGRTKVRQQLHNAVRDYGHNCDVDPNSAMLVPDGYDDWGTVWKDQELYNWWDVDINSTSKYESKAWWD